MPKNITKILKQTSDKIYIKESTTGSEPAWAAVDEIGYTDEASLIIESKKATLPEGGGAQIQVNSDFSIKLNALQVLDQSTILPLKNKNVWIMVKPTGVVSATNQEIKVRNIILNVEPKIDASKNNKSMLVLSAEKSEYDEANVYSFASSSTSVS